MEITVFEYPGCPYCRQGRAVIEELVQENPSFEAFRFNRIDETQHPELSDQYEYNYCPCFFAGRKKIYEASRFHSREMVKAKLYTALTDLLKEQ